jgi:hypothetical protein
VQHTYVALVRVHASSGLCWTYFAKRVMMPLAPFTRPSTIAVVFTSITWITTLYQLNRRYSRNI